MSLKRGGNYRSRNRQSVSQSGLWEQDKAIYCTLLYCTAHDGCIDGGAGMGEVSLSLNFVTVFPSVAISYIDRQFVPTCKAAAANRSVCLHSAGTHLVSSVSPSQLDRPEFADAPTERRSVQ